MIFGCVSVSKVCVRLSLSSHTKASPDRMTTEQMAIEGAQGPTRLAQGGNQKHMTGSRLGS